MPGLLVLMRSLFALLKNMKAVSPFLGALGSFFLRGFFSFLAGAVGVVTRMTRLGVVCWGDDVSLEDGCGHVVYLGVLYPPHGCVRTCTCTIALTQTASLKQPPHNRLARLLLTVCCAVLPSLSPCVLARLGRLGLLGLLGLRVCVICGGKKGGKSVLCVCGGGGERGEITRVKAVCQRRCGG